MFNLKWINGCFRLTSREARLCWHLQRPHSYTAGRNSRRPISRPSNLSYRPYYPRPPNTYRVWQARRTPPSYHRRARSNPHYRGHLRYYGGNRSFNYSRRLYNNYVTQQRLNQRRFGTRYSYPINQYRLSHQARAASRAAKYLKYQRYRRPSTRNYKYQEGARRSYFDRKTGIAHYQTYQRGKWIDGQVSVNKARQKLVKARETRLTKGRAQRQDYYRKVCDCPPDQRARRIRELMPRTTAFKERMAQRDQELFNVHNVTPLQLRYIRNELNNNRNLDHLKGNYYFDKQGNMIIRQGTQYIEGRKFYSVQVIRDDITAMQVQANQLGKMHPRTKYRKGLWSPPRAAEVTVTTTTVSSAPKSEPKKPVARKAEKEKSSVVAPDEVKAPEKPVDPAKQKVLIKVRQRYDIEIARVYGLLEQPKNWHKTEGDIISSTIEMKSALEELINHFEAWGEDGEIAIHKEAMELAEDIARRLSKLEKRFKVVKSKLSSKADIGNNIESDVSLSVISEQVTDMISKHMPGNWRVSKEKSGKVKIEGPAGEKLEIHHERYDRLPEHQLVEDLNDSVLQSKLDRVFAIFGGKVMLDLKHVRLKNGNKEAIMADIKVNGKPEKLMLALDAKKDTLTAELYVGGERMVLTAKDPAAVADYRVELRESFAELKKQLESGKILNTMGVGKHLNKFVEYMDKFKNSVNKKFKGRWNKK